MPKEKEIDPYGFYIYYLDIEDHWTPHIIDYAIKELKRFYLKISNKSNYFCLYYNKY